MANFQLNHAMRSFTDLEEAARLYDAVFDAWTRAPRRCCRSTSTASATSAWSRTWKARCAPCSPSSACPGTPGCSTTRRAAAGRGHIRTASYAQVAEPIYRRAAGRWERYRDQLAPVLPILAPWAETMGYET